MKGELIEGSYGIALIKAEQVNKNYVLEEITVHALGDISFELYRGELIVILGPNGLREGTLLNILGGIETTTSGGLLYGGKELDQEDKKVLTAYRRTHVGFVFQFYNLMPGLTAPGDVELVTELGERPLGVGGLMEQVGLVDRVDRFPSKPSRGQQQRVTIVRTLRKNLGILLYNEPTGALDSRTGVQILRLLVDFSCIYQKIVVLITHNQKIAQIVHRVFYFKDRCLGHTGQNESPLRPEETDW